MYAEGWVMQQSPSLAFADVVAVGALLTGKSSAVALLARFNVVLACILCLVAVLLPGFSVAFSLKCDFVALLL
jgi:hypothetical protein